MPTPNENDRLMLGLNARERVTVTAKLIVSPLNAETPQPDNRQREPHDFLPNTQVAVIVRVKQCQEAHHGNCPGRLVLIASICACKSARSCCMG